MAGSLDAIARTTFGYSIGSPDDPIGNVLAQLGPFTESKGTLLMDSLIEHFPSITKIPSSKLEPWKKLQREFGKVARRIWELGTKVPGTHTTLLDIQGTLTHFALSYSSIVMPG